MVNGMEFMSVPLQKNKEDIVEVIWGQTLTSITIRLENNCFCTLMRDSVLAYEFVRLDLQYLKVFPSELEPALKIAVWMEPNMEKCSSTGKPGFPARSPALVWEKVCQMSGLSLKKDILHTSLSGAKIL